MNGHCFKAEQQLDGHQDGFYNNTCIINVSSDSIDNEYGGFLCSNPSDQWPKLGDNTIYMVQGNENKIGLCNKTETEFQNAYPGIDEGTVIKGAPNNAQIISQAKALLNIS